MVIYTYLSTKSVKKLFVLSAQQRARMSLVAKGNSNSFKLNVLILVAGNKFSMSHAIS
jgi:hypothetical protein